LLWFLTIINIWFYISHSWRDPKITIWLTERQLDVKQINQFSTVLYEKIYIGASVWLTLWEVLYKYLYTIQYKLLPSALTKQLWLLFRKNTVYNAALSNFYWHASNSTKQTNHWTSWFSASDKMKVNGS